MDAANTVTIVNSLLRALPINEYTLACPWHSNYCERNARDVSYEQKNYLPIKQKISNKRSTHLEKCYMFIKQKNC